jgi:signal transduction histidine kinase
MITNRMAHDLPLQEADPLKAYLVGQPRRVRFFNDRLELIWCNRPGVDDEDWIFAHDGSPHALPPEGPMLDSWPVAMVLRGRRTATRLYPAKPHPVADDSYPAMEWKMTAWPLKTDEGLIIVEETERIVSSEGSEVAIKKLDQDIEDLLGHVFSYLHDGVNTGPLRLPNPYLMRCKERRVCTNKDCAAYNNPDAERCWEVTAFKSTHSNGQVDILSKFHSCSQCHVFDQASPNPMARISENFNRLISLLQFKYQETLDVQHRIQQADKLAIMGELLAGIAHEIKNPLGIIIGRLDVIGLEMDSMDKDVLAEDIATIYQQANRVRQIIDHLLAMARPQPPSFKPVHVNSIVIDSLEMVRKALAQKRIQVHMDLQQDLPPIHADQIQVQQVLLNLLLNARDAMGDEGKLEITTRIGSNGRGGVEVVVTDNGEGIAPEVLQRLFSSFQTTKINQGGTGLGLAVCKRIMELHQGQISAESTVGHGTAMRLWFPLKGKHV